MKTILFAILLFYSVTLQAQEPICYNLAKDVNLTTGITSSNPKFLKEFNGKLYFNAKPYENSHEELYSYDGNNAQLVSKINPTGSSNPSNFAVFNGKLYFSATKAGFGSELWEYDGINPPTLVMDIQPGISSSNPLYLTTVGNKLYFRATTFANGTEVWEYDGVGPPVPVTALQGIGSPQFFCEYNSKLYFSGGNATIGQELWEYDGMNAPVSYDINAGNTSSGPSELYASSLGIYFRAYSASFGWEPYRFFNGATSQLADINLFGNSQPGQFHEHNGNLYFRADDDTHGYELWEHDGTSAPTMVSDIIPGNIGSGPGYLTSYNNKLFFAGSLQNGDYEMYSYDGTNITAIDLNLTENANIGHLNVYNGEIFMNAFSGIDGYELHSYSTANGFNLANNIADYNYESEFYDPVEFDGKIFSNLTNGNQSGLFSFDGVNEQYIGNFTGPDTCNGVYNLTVFNGQLIFSGEDKNTGDTEMWIYDSQNGQSLLANISASSSSYPQYYTEFQGKLYFTADDGINGKEMWVYDGTNPPTLFADIASGSGSSDPYGYTVFQNKLYFGASQAIGDYEMYVYDGVGTPTILMNINPTIYGSYPYDFTISGDSLYFVANNGTDGSELWLYDGANPPYMLQDIFSGSNGSNPENFMEFEDKLYFTATTQSSGRELWVYDKVNPAQIFENLEPGNGSSDAVPLAVFEGRLFFVADVNGQYENLWSYDGVNPSVQHMLNSSGDDQVDTYSGSAAYQGRLYFAAKDLNGGQEIHFVDVNVDQTITSSNGTFITDNIFPGANYQWLDCGNSFSAINGETASSFTPNINGTYAVQMNDRGCIDTSSCLSILDVSLSEFEENNMTVYPNPFKQTIHVSIPKNWGSGQISLIDIQGKKIETWKSKIINDNEINIGESLESGIYFLKFESDEQRSLIKIVKN